MRVFLLTLILSLFTFDVQSKPITEYFSLFLDQNPVLLSSSKIEEVSLDYLKASVTDVMDVEMCFLRNFTGDNVVCVIRTYKRPNIDSVVEFYDIDWNYKGRLNYDFKVLFPDLITYEKYFAPILYKTVLNKETKQLHVSLVPVNLSMDEIKNIESLKMSTILKWDGETFK